MNSLERRVLGMLLLACPALAFAERSVVEIAREFPDGGGYHWVAGASGVKEPVTFRGETLLEACDEGSFCCGYTFAVAVRAAEERGLLADKSVEEMKRFLKLWYGAPGGDKTLVVLAAQTLGVGRATPLDEAEPGDFVQLWREGGSGHSVIFLEWVEEANQRVGFRYRSSQPATDGVGDRTEYFADAPDHDGRVLRDQTYACRLLESPTITASETPHTADGSGTATEATPGVAP
ncbi:hypothetical protein MalM25_26120 [Planctomycetes bacterium MalM25]|nr:hypothetical protein MalM25_26120 [Planctomycetes bacterium MalM25]